MIDALEIEAHILGEDDWIAVTEVCRLCRLDLPDLIELTELGVVDPRGPLPDHWEFPVAAISRLRLAARLMRDLGLNVSGAALAVELMEERLELERRLGRLQSLAHE